MKILSNDLVILSLLLLRFCGGFIVLLLPTANAFSAHSSFTSRSRNALGSPRSGRRQPRRGACGAASAASLTMFESNGDPPQSQSPSGRPQKDAWTVLSDTERWISDTLASTETTTPAGGTTNPYTRKEVSYVCETASDQSMIVANVFRRLKEFRERGERHGADEEERAEKLGEEYSPRTFRQTQVIVIPGNAEFCDSFRVFDRLVEAVNRARRNARDYVTDHALDRLDDRLSGAADPDDEVRDWSVSVNLAHLHPAFGERSPEQVLEEMRREEEAGEVDVHYQEYKEKRAQARRSPYPTLVLEVRATPPPDFGASPPPRTTFHQASTQRHHRSSRDDGGGGGDSVTAEDVQRLEALFGKSAHVGGRTSSDDAFYEALGNTIQEISAVTPLKLVQRFVSEHDPKLRSSQDDASTVTTTTAAFTETDTTRVDAAYEFIFTNLAMMAEMAASSAASASSSTSPSLTAEDAAQQRQRTRSRRRQRQYLVMPHFLSSAATSFEKFAGQVAEIVGALPDLVATRQSGVTVETFHPEHVDRNRRSPVPVFVLQWETTTTATTKDAKE